MNNARRRSDTTDWNIQYDRREPVGDSVSPLYGTSINQVFGSTLKGGFEYAGGGNGRYAWPTDNVNFAPRAGTAYKITNRLVARLGAGIFFLPTSAMLSFDHPGPL
jgi:hypothetical protein